MANPEHVAVVQKGVAYIEEWRRKHPGQTFDLRGAILVNADLHEANLEKACLQKAILTGADLVKTNLAKAHLQGATLVFADLSLSDLHGANLSGAICFETSLKGANLRGANLSGADLDHADLTYTDLSGADFSNVNLRGTKFIYSQLSGSDFSGSIMIYTTIAACNLARCLGLETVKHKGPSNIDFRTVENSFYMAGNCLTSEIEIFLLNSGISKELLDTLPKILGEVKYCSSFVCYGQPDIEFAKRLNKDLKVLGVSCWLYSLDATPGKRTWGEITQMRREADKMIVLCSDKALIRDGVLKEIEEQIDEDPEKIVPISLDYTWKERGFLVRRGERDLKPFLEERNYADFCVESEYEGSLKRLLKGLKRTKR